MSDTYLRPFLGEMAWGWLQQLVTLPIATWLVKVFWRRKVNGGSATPAGVPQANLG